MKILLVDDDSSIIEAFLPALQALPGHEAQAAASAEEALERAPEMDGIDLLITDIVMGPMDGFSLREQLEAWYPGLRTIFISGYDLSEYTERTRGARVLAKPFGSGELISALAAAVMGPAEGTALAPVLEILTEDHTPEAVALPTFPDPVFETGATSIADMELAVTEATVAAVQPEAPPAEAYSAPAEASVPPAQTEFDLTPAANLAPPMPAPLPVTPVAASAPLADELEASMPEQDPPSIDSPPSEEPVPVALERVPAEPVSAPQALSPRATPLKPTAPSIPAVAAAPKVTATPATTLKPVATAKSGAAPGARPAGPAVAPVAGPRAVASQRATSAPGSLMAPKAVPRPVAAQAATPVGIPKPPTAVPAKAVPTAVPVAKVAAAGAVPVARAVSAAPGATTIAPSAVPTARAAVPVARPMAVPRAAVPVKPAKPVAAVRAVAAVVPPPPARESHESSAHLIGQVIGGYRIVAQLGEGRWGSVFHAVQTSINRPVGLKVLDPSRVDDEAQKDRFIADARAKAHVQHAGILSVYEAGSADGWIFYTQEYVDGHHLEELAATGGKVDEPTALKLLKTAADGLAYFTKSDIPHTPFQQSDLYLGADGQPRLSNLATQLSDQPTSVPQEIEVLGRALLAVLDPGAGVSTAMRALLGRTMRTNSASFKDWAALLQAVKALEPKVVPLEVEKISAQERAALATVEKARQQQRRAFLMNVIALISLLLFAVAAVYFVWIRSNERKLDEQIDIPAGPFISGDGKNSTTGEFWIDKYEVTIGEYAKFVRWIEQNVGEQHAFDHPKQPRQLSHVPEYWEIYYKNALKGGAAHRSPISLNSPMLTATWWDAYAYAKWRGRDLPTELEWEKAARGTTGNAFPWGEEADPKRANTNADFNERNPEAKAGVDGFNYWGDVDEQSKDKSPFGVIGMAGNVAEWTVDWADNKYPVIKGGSFKTGLQPMGARIANLLPGTSEEYIGFRTISRTAPASK